MEISWQKHKLNSTCLSPLIEILRSSRISRLLTWESSYSMLHQTGWKTFSRWCNRLLKSSTTFNPVKLYTFPDSKWLKWPVRPFLSGLWHA